MFPLHPHDPPSVGPFHLHARLGEDTHARVYLGSAPGEAPVAVRVVRSEYAVDPRFRPAFARLVEDAYGAESRYVCRVRAADTDGAVPWVAVDRPLGADLVREHGPLPAGALHDFALALALGLADLHAAGRTHGSPWPQGVVLSAESALLADPGLEWAVADLDRRAPHPSFAAPEGGVSAATDVFAWAATVSFAASGVEGPPGLPRVPLQLRGLVDACLRRGAGLRPSSADLVRMLGGPSDPVPWPPEVLASVREVAERQREALEEGAASGGEASGGDADDAEGPSTGATDTPRGRRGRRGRVLALSAAGLALAVVAGIAVWEHREPSGGEAGGAEEANGVITDAACGDGVGYPAPGGGVGGEEVIARETAFSPDGDLLAVTASGAGLMVWDWRQREEVARLSESVVTEAGPVFAPVGCVVAAVLPTAYEDQEHPVGVATTFDLPSGTTTAHLGPQRGPVDGNWTARPRDAEDVSFSPDGSLLGVTLEHVAITGADSVGVVDTGTGERTHTLAPEYAHETVFADSGRVLTNNGGRITVWDVETGEKLYNVRGVAHDGFTVVPDSDELLYFDGERVVWWDYVERAEVASFRLPGFADAEKPRFLDLALSPDRSRVYASWFSPTGDAFGGGGRYDSHVWDVETGEDLAAGNEDAVPLHDVSVHPGGGVLAAVTPEGNVVMVDAETLEPLGQPLF
uniref:hypothetical protein n=1 Tax=Nocardiopsis halotolerans TaxID=124252 RepID=UPI00036FAC06|nr:hypothetical protein [Nocardiopsis halotolerans]